MKHSRTVVGYAFDPYYARYARLRVVAEIPSTDEFFNLTTQELKSVEERLTGIGVKAVVAKNSSALSNPNWRDLKVSDSAHFSVLKIR